jgi:hypothetical protein
MVQDKVGIELLKKFLAEAVEFFLVVKDKMKDGYQWTDLWAIVMQGRDLTFVFSNWEEISNELGELDDEEIMELTKQAVGDLGLTDEELVTLVGDIAEFANAGYNVFKSIKAMKDTPVPPIA